MKTVVMIPARMEASRFPGKPLAMIDGLPMIEHVRRRALLAEGCAEVIVATCNTEIEEVVTANGGKVIMTANTHERCTDRIAEAAAQIDADIIVNLQGDEPCVMPQCITDVARPLQKNADCGCSCLIYPVATYEELSNTNLVKAVLSQSQRVLYFCRKPIPSCWKADPPALYKQSGIMAYRRDFLLDYITWPQTPLERVESVDMLRILERDCPIQGVVTPYETPGVDVPDDIVQIEALLRDDPLQCELRKAIDS